jgi:uncharacterized protein YkwD
VTHAGRGDSTTLSRIDRAAYPGVPRHEMIAADFDDAVATLDAWLRSKDHCDAIFDAKIDEVGIGHAMTLRGDAAGWVLLTGEIR